VPRRRRPGAPGLDPIRLDHVSVRGREAWPHRASRSRDPPARVGDTPPSGPCRAARAGRAKRAVIERSEAQKTRRAASGRGLPPAERQAHRRFRV